MVKAVVVLSSSEGGSGTIHFVQDGHGPTNVIGTLADFDPGVYDLQIHTFGDITNGGSSTGPPFNPASDLGNVTVGADRNASISTINHKIHLSGPHSIIGRALVVHADPDNPGAHELCQSTGNAGGRIACGVIGLEC